MSKKLTKDKEDYIFPKVSASNYRASKYMEKKLIAIKGKMDSSTIRVENFKTPHPVINRTNKQKISKYIEVHKTE